MRLSAFGLFWHNSVIHLHVFVSKSILYETPAYAQNVSSKFPPLLGAMEQLTNDVLIKEITKTERVWSTPDLRSFVIKKVNIRGQSEKRS